VIQYHRLELDDLSALASGLGGAPVVRELCASQLSRHLLLLKFVNDSWVADRRHLDAAVSVLAETQRRGPQVFAELMGDPLVGAWLARTTRRLNRPESGSFPLTGDLFHLGAVAASAAVRLGIDCQLTAYARAGRLTLPTLGEATLDGDLDGPVTIRVSAGQATLLGSPGATDVQVQGDGWQDLRRLTARDGDLACALTIEDGNPYRDGYHAPPSERLSAPEAARWQDLFAEAWELICRFMPERAAEMAVGLRAIVPLVDDGSGAARSGTARDSIGALGLTRPGSAADFAITLVHEFQHSKLSAVLDLQPLYVPEGAERHFAPWRTDARPTSGLVQGVYAFLGVADAWRSLLASRELTETAAVQLATVREQVRVGLAALEDSVELTPAGRHFTSCLRVAVDRLFAARLPDEVLREAQSSLDEQWSTWRLRHPGLAAHAQ
jgi:HEXXH motif-containing protein